jgi:hypothetical protein
VTGQLSFFDSAHCPSLNQAQDILGPEETQRLAQLPRDRIMSELRVKHRWTLQAIGDLFDISRERVRQITPQLDETGRSPFREAEKEKKPNTDAILQEILRSAIHTSDAWSSTSGRLSKSWVVERLGYDPEGVDFRTVCKMEIILRYGLGLETKGEMRRWASEIHRDKGYNEIAQWISREFIPVDTMTVHRFLKEIWDE